MQILSTIADARAWAASLRLSGKRVGVVPTMGALHAGHLSLVKASVAQCDATAATIFVNPSQFAPHEDYERYPRTFERDCKMLAEDGCAAVFAPSREEMYPAGYSTGIKPPASAEDLEGRFRPTHFAGVCEVVLKLFNITQATDAYFGLKDYQQFIVLRQTVEDLNVPVRMWGLSTVREADGLAMSSRNRYLGESERRRAVGISAALRACRQVVEAGEQEVAALERLLAERLAAAGIDEVQYAVVRDADSLRPIERIERMAVALVAARVGSTRLIDNFLLPSEQTRGDR